MKLHYVKILFVLTFIFSSLAIVGYFQRGDFYHKQSDQFFYLTFADSLRTQGHMREALDLSNGPATSYTTGAALVMFPFSKLGIEQIFLIVSILYLILNLFYI
jgi:hypothetical protein